MAGFASLSESEYSSLTFRNTPPPYRAAMDLADKFGAFDLDDGVCCEGCGRGVKGRCMSMDEVRDEPQGEGKEGERLGERQGGGGGGVEGGGIWGEEKAAKAAFSYEGKGYCQLDCFFEAHKDKPGMCMYVDKLAAVLFEYEGSERKEEEGELRK